MAGPLGTLCAPPAAPFPRELGILWLAPRWGTRSHRMLLELRNQTLQVPLSGVWAVPTEPEWKQAGAMG